MPISQRLSMFRRLLTRAPSYARVGKAGLAQKTVATVSATAFGAFLITTAYAAEPASTRPDLKAGITVEEVQQHHSLETGLWVVLNGKVYDLTDFIMKHPGGAQIIEKYAGTNASLIFNEFHASNFPEKYLPESKCLGPLIGEMEPAPNILADTSDERQQYIDTMPPLSHVVCATDFEYIASKILPGLSWNYYSGGSEEEISLRENHNAFGRVFYKPRALRDVRNVDISTTMLGSEVAAPFYCSAAAMAKLGHPDGECSIARGCGKEGIMQMICHQASYPFHEIHQQVLNQPQWAQVIPLSYEHALNGIKEASSAGVPAVFVTCDVPIIGKRTKDMKFRQSHTDASGSEDLKKANIVFDEMAPITWDDLDKLQKDVPNTPLMIKGLQSVDDVVMAAERGVKAVVLSNHGGRQLDFSRAPLEILADVMPVLRAKGLDDKIEVYIDGGVRRGSDILKAVALGAKGVGLGRLFLYANACYGEDGVRHLIGILEQEMMRDMRMLGVTKLADLTPEYVDTRTLYARTSPPEFSYLRNYEGPPPPVFA